MVNSVPCDRRSRQEPNNSGAGICVHNLIPKSIEFLPTLDDQVIMINACYQSVISLHVNLTPVLSPAHRTARDNDPKVTDKFIHAPFGHVTERGRAIYILTSDIDSIRLLASTTQINHRGKPRSKAAMRVIKPQKTQR